MKAYTIKFKNFLFFVGLLSVVFTSAQTQNPITSVQQKGIYVSLNFNGYGFQGQKQYLSYLIFTGESGIWLKENIVTGISFSTPWLANNIGISQNYTPFEGNVFLKYYPFKKKGLNWLGLQTQAGLANSGMDVSDTKENLFTNIALGPSVYLKIGKSNFNLNVCALYNLKLGASTIGQSVSFGQRYALTGYLGIAYTFKKYAKSNANK